MKTLNKDRKEHIKYKEKKIAKNLGLLNKRSLLVLYYSFIYTDINYGNIAWGSTNRIYPGEVPIEKIFKKSTVYKNMPSGSYIVNTDSHMPESYFDKAEF